MVDPNVINRVKTLRRLKGWSQLVLASRSGVSISAIQKIEQGILSPSPRLVKRLAAGFEVPADQVFCRIRTSEQSRHEFLLDVLFPSEAAELENSELLRFKTSLSLMPEDWFEELISQTRPLEWEEIVKRVRSFLKGICRDARIGELLAEDEHEECKEDK